MYPGYPKGCKTLVEPRQAIEVNCLLNLFLVIFASWLGVRTDFVGMQSLVLPAANEAVPGTCECSVCEQF
jgi:hypothetical protein